MNTNFPNIKFSGQLRPSQAEVVEIAKTQLEAGERQLYIVAPPGSGKTVLGLYLWAECIRTPALVLSPNTAIQSQWAARTSLFNMPEAGSQFVSTDPSTPKLLTSLTYQSITLPRRGGKALDREAIQLWEDQLIEKGQAQDPLEAEAWIKDLKRHNLDYYDRRLGSYRKKIRDEAGLQGESFEMLHRSSLATLNRIREQNVGLVILDECHHLVGHWGRVLADAQDYLNHPIIVGLTATPPDDKGKAPEDVERYQSYFGPIDFDVPVPAVVKDGFLAPYQDLAYFVRPSSKELQFIANTDDHLHRIVEQACAAREEPTLDEPNSEESTVEEESEEELPTLDLADLAVVSSSETVFDEEEDAFLESLVTSDEEKDKEAEPIKKRTSPEEVSIQSVDLPPRVPALLDWLYQVLKSRKHAMVTFKSWSAFQRRDPEFAHASRIFLQLHQRELPPKTPEAELDVSLDEVPEMSILVPVLDRYVRHALRRSPREEDQQLAADIIGKMRMLGVQISETGSQACASPVGRVLAYSAEKAKAIVPILSEERKALGDDIRAIVVTDFEKSSATISEIKDLLHAEAGGAIAAFKTLINNPNTDQLNPILVTGSSVLIDDDLAERFDAAAKAWLKEKKFNASFVFAEQDGFHVVSGEGPDWSPRVYVEMITELFQQGLTKCLVGTRGLLGEGWDANKINVLVDLTTVTTSMTVRQLRGRSFRLDPQEPEKLANNWDVVCLAPEFSKGLDDYARFIKKHKNIFGVTDDGAIEKGVGHVHAALTDLKPELLEDSVQLINRDMLQRVNNRSEVRGLWKIGEPYQGKPIKSIEARLKPSSAEGGGFPPFAGAKQAWTNHSLTQSIGEAILRALHEAKLIKQYHTLKANERNGGYVRLFLEEAPEEDCLMFTQALHQAIGPLHRPRYVIPRELQFVKTNWLSRMLPSFLGQYLEQRENQMVMLHAVPNLLAKNKDLVAIYERHWNELVSPGQAVYALKGEGEELIIEAQKAGMTPKSEVHEKDIFT